VKGEVHQIEIPIPDPESNITPLLWYQTKEYGLGMEVKPEIATSSQKHIPFIACIVQVSIEED